MCFLRLYSIPSLALNDQKSRILHIVFSSTQLNTLGRLKLTSKIRLHCKLARVLAIQIIFDLSLNINVGLTWVTSIISGVPR